MESQSQINWATFLSHYSTNWSHQLLKDLSLFKGTPALLLLCLNAPSIKVKGWQQKTGSCCYPDDVNRVGRSGRQRQGSGSCRPWATYLRWFWLSLDGFRIGNIWLRSIKFRVTYPLRSLFSAVPFTVHACKPRGILVSSLLYDKKLPTCWHKYSIHLPIWFLPQLWNYHSMLLSCICVSHSNYHSTRLS